MAAWNMVENLQQVNALVRIWVILQGGKFKRRAKKIQGNSGL